MLVALVCFVYLVYLVHLVSFVQLNKRDKPNKPQFSSPAGLALPLSLTLRYSQEGIRVERP